MMNTLILTHFSPMRTSSTLLKAAVATLALRPSVSLAFTDPINYHGLRHHLPHSQSSDSLTNNYSILHRPWALGFATPLVSTLSSDSNATTTYGSFAVRSMKPPQLPAETEVQLLSFYHFTPISQPGEVRDILFEHLEIIPGLRGTVYVAHEGINAQFAVPTGEPLNCLLKAFGKPEGGGCLPFDAFEKNPPNMGDVVDGTKPTFDRLIVRTRNYILRDGIQELDNDLSLDWNEAGIELNPEDWDKQLRQQSNIQLLDCRNKYESDMGSFVSAKPLDTETFSETWSVLDSKVQTHTLDPKEPVYIFCTGGIRCVKVGAYLKQKLGFDDVRSLKHGIIGYEKWDSEQDGNKPEDGNLWIGENFLFDKRRLDGGKSDEG